MYAMIEGNTTVIITESDAQMISVQSIFSAAVGTVFVFTDILTQMSMQRWYGANVIDAICARQLPA